MMRAVKLRRITELMFTCKVTDHKAKLAKLKAVLPYVKPNCKNGTGIFIFSLSYPFI
jgi:hypothetical protein